MESISAPYGHTSILSTRLNYFRGKREECGNDDGGTKSPGITHVSEIIVCVRGLLLSASHCRHSTQGKWFFFAICLVFFCAADHQSFNCFFHSYRCLAFNAHIGPDTVATHFSPAQAVINPCINRAPPPSCWLILLWEVTVCSRSSCVWCSLMFDPAKG